MTPPAISRPTRFYSSLVSIFTTAIHSSSLLALSPFPLTEPQTTYLVPTPFSLILILPHLTSVTSTQPTHCNQPCSTSNILHPIRIPILHPCTGKNPPPSPRIKSTLSFIVITKTCKQSMYTGSDRFHARTCTVHALCSSSVQSSSVESTPLQSRLCYVVYVSHVTHVAYWTYACMAKHLALGPPCLSIHLSSRHILG